MKSRLRILIVMHGAGMGGVEQAMAILCKHLDQNQFEPIVMLPSKGPLQDYLCGIGIHTVITPLDWWTPIQFDFGERHYYKFLAGLKERVEGIIKIIKDYNIDLVHSSTLTVADGAFAAELTGKPHIWHLQGSFTGLHHEPFGSYLPIETLYGMVNTLSTRIVTSSQAVKDFHAQYIPAEEMDVIYNGIDLEQFDHDFEKPDSLADEFPDIKGKIIIATIGRIARVKGTGDYVEAAMSVLRNRNDVRFLIIGQEQEKEFASAIKQRISDHGLAEKIILAGYRENIPVSLKQINLFVCASLKEGFPYSCLEAMAAAKPVVSTRCGGPEELIIEGKTGFFVNIEEPDHLAEVILELIKEPDKMKQFGQRGRKRVEEHFSGHIYARNFENLYINVLKKINIQNQNVHPWAELMVEFVTNLGSLGSRSLEHERNIRDLRGFEALFKDNFVYRSLRKAYGHLKSKHERIKAGKS